MTPYRDPAPRVLRVEPDPFPSGARCAGCGGPLDKLFAIANRSSCWSCNRYVIAKEAEAAKAKRGFVQR